MSLDDEKRAIVVALEIEKAHNYFQIWARNFCHSRKKCVLLHLEKQRR